MAAAGHDEATAYTNLPELESRDFCSTFMLCTADNNISYVSQILARSYTYAALRTAPLQLAGRQADRRVRRRQQRIWWQHENVICCYCSWWISRYIQVVACGEKGIFGQICGVSGKIVHLEKEHLRLESKARGIWRVHQIPSTIPSHFYEAVLTRCYHWKIE
jgi:hypothetical protein